MKMQTYKIQDIKEEILKLLERYSSNGDLVNTGENLDINNRFDGCFNRVMRKLCAEFELYRKKVSLVFALPKIKYSYGVIELANDEIFSRSITGKNLAYRLVCSGNGELAFIGCDTESVSIRNSNGGVSEYKGTIAVSDEESHFLLAGTSDLKVYSFEIYEGFEGSEDELKLIGGGVCTLRLPEDFLSLRAVYGVNGERVDQDIFDISYADGTVSVDGEKSGIYTLEYSACHEHYRGGVDLYYTIKLPPILFDALTYMCASELCPSYDGEMYSKLTYKYREVLENCYIKNRNLGSKRNSFYGVINTRLGKRKGRSKA